MKVRYYCRCHICFLSPRQASNQVWRLNIFDSFFAPRLMHHIYVVRAAPSVGSYLVFQYAEILMFMLKVHFNTQKQQRLFSKLAVLLHMLQETELWDRSAPSTLWAAKAAKQRKETLHQSRIARSNAANLGYRPHRLDHVSLIAGRRGTEMWVVHSHHGAESIRPLVSRAGDKGL